jgi:cytoskeleton protein RodZ
MSIGETLATARAEAGLTIDDVSRETRVRATLVRAIERDDFSLCGGDVYARGHIRNIASLLGVDPRPLVAEFDRSHGGLPTPVDNPVPVFDPEVAARTERSRPNWAAAMAVALVVICVIAGVQLVSNGGSGSAGKNPPAALPSAGTGSATPGVPSTPGPAPSDAVAAVPRSGVHLQVRIVGTGARSWVHIAGSDGSTLFEGILDETARPKNFTDPQLINMTIGNAGAVALVVNGSDRGLAGASGEVVHRTFHAVRSSDGIG